MNIIYLYIYKKTEMNIADIEVPTIIVDELKCKSNISRITDRANSSGVILRPHFKTHQSRIIGRWFREAGIEKITCSSVTMAEYFARDNWEDILIAFPFNIREIKRIRTLGQKIKLSISIPGSESAKLLASHCDFNIDVVIKIDTGYGRSGTLWNDTTEINQIVSILKSNSRINLTGLITHAGDSYGAQSRKAISDIYIQSVERMAEAKAASHLADLTISVGDTPTASVVETYAGIDEMRAGNYIFYDLMQYSLGVCSLDDIGIVVACPIVDIDRKAGKVVIYGGAVHFSKEYIEIDGKKVFGQVAEAANSGWKTSEEAIYLAGISQEHGLINLPGNIEFDYKIGDLIYILPVHSCLTSDAIGSYLSTNMMAIDHLKTQYILQKGQNYQLRSGFSL